MILSCNNCGAKFKVSDDAIGPEGRNVRCSACAYEWFQEGSMGPKKPEPAPAPEVPAEPAAPAPVEEKKPIKTELRPTTIKPEPQKLYQKTWLLYVLKGTSLVAFILLIFVLAITYRPKIIKRFPESSALFEAIHLHDVSNLKFDFVDCTINKESNEAEDTDVVELNVKVVAKNTGKTSQLLDVVRFSVYTKDKTFIGDYTMHINKQVEAGKEEVIEGRLNRIPKEVTFVIIEMGNAFNLALSNQSAILNYKDPAIGAE